MANPSDPGTMWDQLLASAQRRASTPDSAQSLTPRRKLPLRPEAKLDHLPGRPRSIDSISTDLRAAIRSVVAGESPWPLVVCGPPGTGKTCAALCLLDVSGGRYWTVSGLCAELIAVQKGHRGHVEGGRVFESDFWNWVSSARLVVLDELGCRDKVSDFAFETVKQVIDDRYAKPLVVLSNHPLDVIATLYDDRISDRLAEGTVIVLRGESRRLRKVGAA